MATSTRGKRYPAEVLTVEEVGKLVRACSNTARTGVRNRALIVLLHRTGLRISEALALLPKDIDEKAGTVRVLHGKGNKARTVGMDVEAFTMVERWLDVRRQMGINDRCTIFCTFDGGRMDPTYVRAAFHRLGEKAGIGKRVHPHGLRHTHAATLAAAGLPINVIQRQLGHANAAITSHYLDHLAPSDVVAAVRTVTWGGLPS